MANDSLARGAKSAMFPPPKVSQEKWDAIWREEEQKPEQEENENLKNEPVCI
jgi:hypothetical protein